MIYLLHNFGHWIDKLVFPLPASVPDCSFRSESDAGDFYMSSIWYSTVAHFTASVLGISDDLLRILRITKTWFWNLLSIKFATSARTWVHWRPSLAQCGVLLPDGIWSNSTRKLRERKFPTYLMFPPSSSTLAAGSNRFSCCSLSYNLCKKNCHLKFDLSSTCLSLQLLGHSYPSPARHLHTHPTFIVQMW